MVSRALALVLIASFGGGCAGLIDLEALERVACTTDCDASAPSDQPVGDAYSQRDGGNSGATAPHDAGADVAREKTSGSADAGAGATVDATLDAPPACPASCGAQSVCVGTSCVAARRVFVSSVGYSAMFNGAVGADVACQSIAGGASLGGTWRAWVSDSSSSPSARFSQASVAYRMMDGTLVASSYASLISGGLAHGIDLDEKRATVREAEVWTATSTDGTYAQSGCNDFTSNTASAPFAAVGISGHGDQLWSNAYLQYCDRTSLRIYCFEQ